MLANANAANISWRQETVAERLKRVRSLRSLLETSSEELARDITGEVGKPLAESRREVAKSLALADYCLENAEAVLAPRTVSAASGQRHLRPTPLGLILTISPSNFPLWQVVRSTLPPIVAGNVVLNKAAPGGARCAQALVDLAMQAGFPPGTWQFAVTSPASTQRLIRHPLVRGIAFTGGRDAGRAVGSAAGMALKPALLELGGNDAAVILADADLPAAIGQCVTSRLYNNGQTCLGPKRLIVEQPLYAQALAIARDLLANAPHGDPWLETTSRGPLLSLAARDRLHRQVGEARRDGARLLVGGCLPPGPEPFYPATLLADVPRHSIVYREELFGPVVAISPARDREEAIELANASPFGLAASVFTARREHAAEVAARLEVANIGWNRIARSAPEVGFGGIKESGYGRELGPAGLLAFAPDQVLVGLEAG